MNRFAGELRLHRAWDRASSVRLHGHPRHLARLLMPAIVIAGMSFIYSSAPLPVQASSTPTLTGELYGVACPSATACWTASFNAHSFGLTGTYGTGWELPGGASATAGPMFASGAHDPQDLGGGFDYTGVSAGEVFPVGAFDSASGYGRCGQSVTQYGASVGVGVNLPWPASVHEGQSNTWVWQP